VFGYLIGQALLSLLPFLRLAFKKRGLNETIKAIFVKLIETALNLAVLTKAEFMNVTNGWIEERKRQIGIVIP
jgi:hypothetical protein